LNLHLLIHPNERRQKHNIKLPQLIPPDIHDVSRMKEHPTRQVRVGRHQPHSHLVSFGVHVIVVERGFGKVFGRKHDGGQGKRTGPDEGDTCNNGGDVLGEEGELEEAEFEVVVVVRE
ncbi:hypothetical protein LINGRAHAP2_LOCUS28337, partial [Linum grandiflorum]